jgi:WD40 repeat protein
MNDRVNALRFSPDGKRLASGSGDPSRAGEVVLWEVTSGKVLKAWPDLHKDAVFAVDFSPDGKLIASGSGDKTVKVLDVASGKIERGFEGHASHVLGVAWRHEGRTILSSGAEGAVKVWDYIGGDRKKSIDGWEGEVTSVSYVGYTGNMLTSSADKRVRLLTETGSEVKSFPGAADFLQGSAISADGSIIVAGGIDGVLRVWDGKSAAIIAEFPVP